ncbi:hypothetical protein PGT21_025945 [Puccinia graminis f. sp. tritici]|uniref:Uncharacterized protein n=1 Tax=Puccinia graminis f. sp. tritici TaxID=56615 RepID=A0A5B0QYA8_PUCGR|nr:hypothetical protein PGT21_025945 [Puccinia graminis f. sp. tritici]
MASRRRPISKEQASASSTAFRGKTSEESLVFFSKHIADQGVKAYLPELRSREKKATTNQHQLQRNDKGVKMTLSKRIIVAGVLGFLSN